MPINITAAADNVLDYIKIEYPKLENWSNKKLIDRISENWADRTKIQTRLRGKARLEP